MRVSGQVTAGDPPWQSWSRATDLYFLIKFFLALQRLYRVRCESSGFSLSSQRHFRRLKTDWREIATDKYNNLQSVSWPMPQHTTCWAAAQTSPVSLAHQCQRG